MAVHRAIATTKKGVLGQVKMPTKTPDAEEVQIQVDSSVLSTFDTYQIDDASYVSSYPHVLGIGGAGTIKAVGKDVKHLKTGDRVRMIRSLWSDVLSVVFMIDRSRLSALGATRTSLCKKLPLFPTLKLGRYEDRPSPNRQVVESEGISSKDP